MQFHIRLSIIAAALFSVLQISPAQAQSSRVRITALGVFDTGSIGVVDDFDVMVDLVQDICDEDDTSVILEPFGDAIAGVTIVNNYSSTIRIDRISFTVKRGDSAGRTANSIGFAPINESEIAAGETKTIYTFMLSGSGGSKAMPGKGGDISLSSGFKTVTVHVRGRDSSGRAVRSSARTTFSFNNYDRCE